MTSWIDGPEANLNLLYGDFNVISVMISQLTSLAGIPPTQSVYGHARSYDLTSWANRLPEIVVCLVSMPVIPGISW